ncbi:MAG: hypothetical protein WC717_03590 [Candidatus Micrarchaeia archaeon]|jgi:hypothetical protein
MEVKAQKTKEGLELVGSLPFEIANAQALEVFPLRDGIYLLSVKGAIGGHAPSAGLSEPERQLVKKLLAIRFEKRTPSDVDKTLTGAEKATLASLLDKKVVNIFRSGKYENGVYNVSDAIFGQTRDIPAAHPLDTAAPQSSAIPRQLPSSSAAGKAAPAKPSFDPLSKGYLVLDNEGDARQLSGAVAERIKAGEVAGLRSFDRKYYFIRKDFAMQHQPKIMSSLEKGDKTADELARVLGLPSEACLAILLHMAEEGELLEKNKGKFALA